MSRWKLGYDKHAHALLAEKVALGCFSAQQKGATPQRDRRSCKQDYTREEWS